MKIGDRVSTPHGIGDIVGWDMPESDRTKRAKVKIDKWYHEHDRELFEPHTDSLCYFLNELMLIQ